MVWGFVSVNFGKFIGGVVIKISHMCVDLLEGEGGVVIAIGLWLV